MTSSSANCAASAIPYKRVRSAALYDEAANHAADEDGERRLERQIHAYREQHRAANLDQDHRDAHRDPDDDERMLC